MLSCTCMVPILHRYMILRPKKKKYIFLIRKKFKNDLATRCFFFFFSLFSRYNIFLDFFRHPAFFFLNLGKKGLTRSFLIDPHADEKQYSFFWPKHNFYLY